MTLYTHLSQEEELEVLDELSLGFAAPTRYPTIQMLLDTWLPSGGRDAYRTFLNEQALTDILTTEQLQELHQKPKACMGRKLAGAIWLHVPPDYCTWVQIRNIYERQAAHSENQQLEIDISQEAFNNHLDNIVSNANLALNFGELLRLCRRHRLLTRTELANLLDTNRTVIDQYEWNERIPEPITIHKLCDALKTSMDMRMRMLVSACKDASIDLSQNDIAKIRRNYLKAITGGGSMFGMLLYHLRHAKNMSQEQLALKCNLSPKTITNYEHGINFSDPIIVCRLANALEVDDHSRILLMDTAGRHAFAKLEGTQTKDHLAGLHDLTGGGSIFGMLLYHLRTQKGWSQQELGNKCAEISGIQTSFRIAQYELGRSRPPADIAHIICDALEVNKDTRWLMLYSANHEASAQLEQDKRKPIRKALTALTGGGSIFGMQLYHLRTKKGLTHQQLAQSATVSEASISLYENGTNLPTDAVFEKLCTALEVNADQKAHLAAAIQHGRATRVR